MIKRLFDIAIGALALVVTAPVMVVAVIGIKLTSPGPVFYRARRTGRNGAVFWMYKLRSMHLARKEISSITSPRDKRIFPFGNLIRQLKVDELPQFWNILIGDMAVVGPRPEAPDIVAKYYTDWMHETLCVRPGLTSPGAIYNYLMADTLLNENDPEGSYVQNLLPPKLALERAYINRKCFLSDLRYVWLTIKAINANAFRKEIVLPQVDIDEARNWSPEGPYHRIQT